jgi:hypothetical protein
MNIILDATNEYITARQEGRTRSVPKPKRNLKPVSREFANVPDDIVSMDELVTFLSIQMLISYHRLLVEPVEESCFSTLRRENNHASCWKNKRLRCRDTATTQVGD